MAAAPKPGTQSNPRPIPPSPAQPAAPTLAHRLLEALRDRGATEVFGIPGDFALPLFRGFEKSGLLPVYTLSHEPAVGFAADAAARVRGGLGVAAVTYGAGAFNLVNPVAAAFAERVPVVVLSGAPAAREVASGYLLHHQAKTLDSQWRVFGEITVDRARLDDPLTAPGLIARVLDAALERSRPVYLEVPRDMPGRACGEVPARVAFVPDPERLEACARELLQRLQGARHPVLMVGVEVRRYGLEARVAALARALGIPVVTNMMGQGLLAEQDVKLSGIYLGLAGDPAVSDLVESSDGLLLLGVIVSDTNFAVSGRRIDIRHAMHVFDGEVSMGHHVYHELPIGHLVDAMLGMLTPRAASVPGIAPAEALRAEGAKSEGRPSRIASARLDPEDIARAVNELMHRHGAMPIACDMGDCLFTAFEIGPAPLVAPGYYAGMGYAVPAALGVQVSTGRRPIVLVGDGAFAMTGWELGNARRCGCDPIVLVFNNCGWEMLRTFEPESRLNDLGPWDIASMAAGLGGDGYTVTTPQSLREALAKAHATRGRFQLLDIRLEPGVVSPTMQRYVAAVRRLSAAPGTAPG
jgi:indolepyruvate decarboxylase